MAETPPGTPRQAWVEKDEATLTPTSATQPSEVCELQPLQADPSCSTWAVPREDESTLKAILGFIRCRPEHLAQKLIFLDSLCTFCVDSALQGVLCFFQEEVIMTIQWLLQEEPIDCLDTAVRQQAMPAIASMSRARLLQQDKYSILQACFKSVFSLPPQHSWGSAAFLYSKTLSVMDSMLEALVCSAGTLGVVELQNLLKESDTVRELSICLFRDVMRLVARKEKKKMKEVVCNSLLPLLFHLHDEIKSVAKLIQNYVTQTGHNLHILNIWQVVQDGESVLTMRPQIKTRFG